MIKLRRPPGQHSKIVTECCMELDNYSYYPLASGDPSTTRLADISIDTNIGLFRVVVRAMRIEVGC